MAMSFSPVQNYYFLFFILLFLSLLLWASFHSLKLIEGLPIHCRALSSETVWLSGQARGPANTDRLETEWQPGHSPLWTSVKTCEKKEWIISMFGYAIQQVNTWYPSFRTSTVTRIKFWQVTSQVISRQAKKKVKCNKSGVKNYGWNS